MTTHKSRLNTFFVFLLTAPALNNAENEKERFYFQTMKAFSINFMIKPIVKQEFYHFHAYSVSTCSL